MSATRSSTARLSNRWCCQASPARRILDLADAHPGSVIVMSTHGRGALARAALGSVTRETIQDTTTPILVIPPHAPAPLTRTAPLMRPVAAVAHE